MSLPVDPPKECKPLAEKGNEVGNAVKPWLMKQVCKPKCHANWVINSMSN